MATPEQHREYAARIVDEIMRDVHRHIATMPLRDRLYVYEPLQDRIAAMFSRDERKAEAADRGNRRAAERCNHGRRIPY